MSNAPDSAATAPSAAPAPQQGHPPGLRVLFFTEMWERFCYYGMRSLLVYYMIKQLGFAQDKASNIYGLYTAFVYLTPLIGGALADRYLGQRKAVVIGAIIMAIGEFTMMVPALFYPALVLLILGNGCFKPNLATQVGGLYPAGDSRRDRAFSIYYVGVNLGAFLAPLVCGYLGERYGWNYGFGAAGVGMLLGLGWYLLGQKHLAPDNIMQKKAAAQAEAKAEVRASPKAAEEMTAEDWKRVIALAVLCAFNVFFWATYEQQGNTMALWVDNNTDRHIFGWEMPASWFQSFNPAMIFVFTPLVMNFWAWQARRGKEPTSVTKMAIGCLLAGVSYIIMIPPARAVGQASMWWITASTFILTIGELYLSPVGLSLVTKLAPPRMVSMLMGMWFLSSFFGNYLCGYLGTFWEKMPKESFFIMLSGIACFAGVCMLAVLKPLKAATSDA